MGCGDVYFFIKVCYRVCYRVGSGCVGVSGCAFFVDTTKRRDTIGESTCARLFRSAQKSVTKCAVEMVFLSRLGFDLSAKKAKIGENG